MTWYIVRRLCILLGDLVYCWVTWYILGDFVYCYMTWYIAR